MDHHHSDDDYGGNYDDNNGNKYQDLFAENFLFSPVLVILDLFAENFLFSPVSITGCQPVCTRARL